MSDGDLIPFGKHKGRPIESLAEDQQYADWLVQQPWFRERHPKIYNIVINNFCEPSNTPDHNAIQARFLDDDFRLKFASIAIPRLWWYCQSNGEMAATLIDLVATKFLELKAKRDEKPCSVSNIWDYNDRKQITWELSASIGAVVGKDGKCRLVHISRPIFECKGVDVEFSVAAGMDGVIQERFRTDTGAVSNWSVVESKPWSKVAGLEDMSMSFNMSLKIEIKPSIGDDYPQVLRQMRRSGSTFLLTQSYHGEGVDKPTFIKFMDSQGVKVIFEHEIDSAEKISVDDFDREKISKAMSERIIFLGL